MYQAIINFDSEEDTYSDGCIGGFTSQWSLTLTSDTIEGLRGRILEETYSTTDDLEQEDINGYEDATEYHTGYMATIDNEGQASESQLEQWEKGKIKLWYVGCQILVSEITKTKAAL